MRGLFQRQGERAVINYLKLFLPAAFLGIVAVAAIALRLGIGLGGGDETPRPDTLASKFSANVPPSPSL